MSGDSCRGVFAAGRGCTKHPTHVVSDVSREHLARAVADSTGADVVGMTVVHGGDTAAAFRIELASGDGSSPRRTHRRRRASSAPRRAGLAWLRSSDAVHVPRVVAVSDGDVRRAGVPASNGSTSRGGRSGDEAVLRTTARARSTVRAHRASAGRIDGRPGAWRCRTSRARRGRILANCRFLPLAEDRARSIGAPAGHDRPARTSGRTLERFDDGSTSCPAARRPVGGQPARRRDGPRAG